MFKRFINLLISTLLAVNTHIALAKQSDFTMPIEMLAESQFLDGKNKRSVFIDDVQIIQGSLLVKADRIEVEATAGKGYEIFIATGDPAIYSQTLDDGRQVTAEAQEIRYEVHQRMISLKGNAQLNQNTSVVKGESITYDMENEQLMAKGDGSGTGRVKTVFSLEDIEAIKSKSDKENDDDNEENLEQPPR